MGRLAGIKKCRIVGPVRAVVYGPDGVGKTTFGLDAPEPVLLGTEKGSERFEVARLPPKGHPPIRDWEDVLGPNGWLTELVNEDPKVHGWKTLVVDSLDWLEPLIHARVANDAGVRAIEDIPYAGGYKTALRYWREFLEACDVVRDLRGMNVVLICHSKVTKFDPPEGESGWDRYSLKIHDSPKADAAAVVREWADHVLFANYDQKARKKGKWDNKGVGGRARYLYTERTAAYDAKNRCNLPPRMELSWSEFYALAGRPDAVTGVELRAELKKLTELAVGLPESKRAALEKWAAAQTSLTRTALGEAFNRVQVGLEQAEVKDEPVGPDSFLAAGGFDYPVSE